VTAPLLDETTSAKWGVAVAGATATPHTGMNQDAFSIYEEPDCKGVVVADGVGSLPRSGEAATMGAKGVTDLLRRRETTPEEAFTLVNAGISRHLGGDGMTTILSARVLGSRIEFAWVGNGAFLQVCPAPWISESGLPADVTSTIVWSNLLVPHIAYEDGRDRLSRLLGGPGSAEPDLMVIDITRPGVFLAVSDGLHSSEQTEVGRDDAGDRWQRLSPSLYQLLVASATLLGNPNTGAITRSADQVLRDALTVLLEAGELHDDATVAAIVVEPHEEKP
jgi:serine/threonine protein phosphatase PrpC